MVLRRRRRKGRIPRLGALSSLLAVLLLWWWPDLPRDVLTDVLSRIDKDVSQPETSSRPTPRMLQGTALVIDGDTLDVAGTRIRLHGIDAPESRQTCTRPRDRAWRCGRDATQALGRRIARKPVTCERKDVDRYGRVVAVCRQGEEDLNGWMVRQGWAVAYRAYASDYVTSEKAAKAARRGIWAGRFQMPWDWRKARR